MISHIKSHLSILRSTVTRLREWKDIREIRTSHLFDGPYYLERNPDVRAANLDPASHYVRYGWREGRRPSELFDGHNYLAINPDVAASGQNPLLHYIRHGRAERRSVNRPVPVLQPLPIVPPISTDQAIDQVTNNEYVDSLETFYERNFAKVSSLKVSIIIPTYNRASTVCHAIDSILNQTHQNFEVLICNDGSTDDTAKKIKSQYGFDSRIKLINLKKSHVSITRNAGLDAACGDFIAFLDSDNRWTKDYLRYMICVCLSEKVDIAYSGLVAVDASGRNLFTRGESFDREKCRKGNYIDLNVYFYRRTPKTDIRFDPKLKRTVDWDFILQQTIGQKVIYAPFVGCEYVHDMSDTSRISVTQPNIYRAIVRARHSQPKPIPDNQIYKAIALQIAIKIPAPRAKAAQWGDFHFATSLSKSFAALGHTPRIDFLDDWPDRRFDQSDHVVIVLRGLSQFEPQPAAINVMWNISHPDQVDYDEFDKYDIVYTASQSFTSLLKEISTSTVKTLYQATDIERFHPDLKSANLIHNILFVGNSRRVYRDIVRWSIESGNSPDVYGTLWDDYIPAELIKGANINNEDLGIYYASANFVLNDHWESMREYGLLSNRLFDCVACNTTVISDAVPSLASIFGDAVIQVTSQDELSNAFKKRTARQTRLLADAGKFVREHHNFDVRAKTIIRDVLEHVGIQTPEEALAQPFIHQHAPVKVATIAPWNGKHFQSSLYLRLLAPLTSETNANQFEVTCLRPDQSEDIGGYDAVIVQRASVGSSELAERIIDLADENNTALVTDVDDGFILIDETHPEFAVYQPKNDALNKLIANSRENWFSTQHLADAYSEVSSNPVIVENCLDPRFWRNYRHSYTPFTNPVMRMVYMGTTTHDEDFNLILNQLDELNEVAPGAFDLTVIGAVRRLPNRSWLSSLAVPAGYGSYPRFVRWMMKNNRFDVGLAPLVSNKFNDCKSDLKILDYTAMGIVPVVSNVISYRDTATNYNCAFVTEDHNWADTLRSINNDREGAMRVISNATNYLWNERHVSTAATVIRSRLQSMV